MPTSRGGSARTQSRRCELEHLRLHHPLRPRPCVSRARARIRIPPSIPSSPASSLYDPGASLFLVRRCAAPPHPYHSSPSAGGGKDFSGDGDRRRRRKRRVLDARGTGVGRREWGRGPHVKPTMGSGPCASSLPRECQVKRMEMMGRLRLRRGAQQAGSRRTVGWAKTRTGDARAQAELVRVRRRPRCRRGIWDGACAKRRGGVGMGLARGRIGKLLPVLRESWAPPAPISSPATTPAPTSASAQTTPPTPPADDSPHLCVQDWGVEEERWHRGRAPRHVRGATRIPSARAGLHQHSPVARVEGCDAATSELLDGRGRG
ncbi:hypothetical protein DFH09DRAFT_500815 [Mycena vulgaris]|nr:hypothetical protein DFH09DRAFT_500815 [Mycena vulgaris]